MGRKYQRKNPLVTVEGTDNGKPGLPGRPLKQITDEQVYKLGLIHCTVDEIAAHLDCHKSVIYDRFSEALQRGHRDGQQSMKRKMHEIAMNGDVKMLIWLSKQRLGYKDTMPEEAQIVNFNVVVNEVPK